MARGKTLIELLTDLRIKARLSLNPAHNAQARDAQVGYLRSVQDWLWQDFAWPHLRVERQVQVEAGQRYYGVPSDLDIERIDRLELFTDGSWVPMLPGIDGAHYGVWNSDLDERAWPPRRWKLYEDGQIEVWPISDQDADATTHYGYLKFIGIRKLSTFVDDGDRADLDDQLLVLFAAAEMLAAAGSKDAKLKLDQASKRYSTLRGQLSPRRRFQVFGTGGEEPRYRPMISRYAPPA